MTLTPIAHAVILSFGWRRAAIAFAAGALSVLAMAPFSFWPVLFLTLPVAVWLIDGAGADKLGGWPAAALSGWWFGFGYFLAGPLLDRQRIAGRRARHSDGCCRSRSRVFRLASPSSWRRVF